MNFIAILFSALSMNFSTAQDMVNEASLSAYDIMAERIGDKEGYILKRKRFELTFPGKPSESSDVVPTDVGDIDMTSFLYEVSPQEVWMLAYSDYPPKYVDGSNSEELLQGGKNGAMESLGIYNTDTDKNVDVQGNPGLEFSATNGTYFVNYKMVLVGSRLYQVAILKDGKYTDKKKVKNFFKSFKVIF